MRSSTETLVKALRILARDIQSGDGVANAAIAEGAERLAELERENAALRATLTLIRSTTDESGLSQAQVIETVGKYCDEVLGEETRT